MTLYNSPFAGLKVVPARYPPNPRSKCHDIREYASGLEAVSVLFWLMVLLSANPNEYPLVKYQYIPLERCGVFSGVTVRISVTAEKPPSCTKFVA